MTLMLSHPRNGCWMSKPQGHLWQHSGWWNCPTAWGARVDVENPMVFRLPFGKSSTNGWFWLVRSPNFPPLLVRILLFWGFVVVIHVQVLGGGCLGVFGWSTTNWRPKNGQIFGRCQPGYSAPELIQTDLVTKISPESPAMVVQPVPTFGVFWGIPPQVWQEDPGRNRSGKFLTGSLKMFGGCWVFYQSKSNGFVWKWEIAQNFQRKMQGMEKQQTCMPFWRNGHL